jgi:two-component system chemotaxis response regulator CheB
MRYEVIVIGASAGGLTAIGYLLEHLPADFTIPIIVVQHRSKDPKDLLEELLQSKSKIKVKQADEKEKIQPGVVYIAPPDYHLLIERDRTFSLTSDEPVRFSRPSIDVLFESAAEVYRNKSVGIILTGANNDGVAGLAAIIREDGIAIVQNPEEAEIQVMPLASLAANKIHHIFTLDQLRAFLVKLNKSSNG